jgi:hypothetical protein
VHDDSEIAVRAAGHRDERSVRVASRRAVSAPGPRSSVHGQEVGRIAGHDRNVDPPRPLAGRSGGDFDYEAIGRAEAGQFGALDELDARKRARLEAPPAVFRAADVLSCIVRLAAFERGISGVRFPGVGARLARIVDQVRSPWLAPPAGEEPKTQH